MPAESTGQFTKSIAAGVGDTVVSAQAGRFCSLLVVAPGAGTVTVYDNATTHTGTVIGYINATNSNIQGYFISFLMPAANGIVVTQASAGVGLTVSYSL